MAVVQHAIMLFQNALCIAYNIFYTWFVVVVEGQPLDVVIFLISEGGHIDINYVEDPFTQYCSAVVMGNLLMQHFDTDDVLVCSNYSFRRCGTPYALTSMALFKEMCKD